MRATLGHALVAAALLGCSEVAEVLTAPAQAGGAGGSGGAAGGGRAGGGASGSSGASSSGGAPPDDPSLGVFIAAGDAHACAARFGVLYCWGENMDGRLGVGDQTNRNAPARVGADADWTAVAAGVAHTCALKQDGSVWCFGANNFGQLGQGTLTPSSVPLPVALPARVSQLSAEANTACAVLLTGELYCWGRNWEGNIGLNDTHPGIDQQLPVRSGVDADWELTGTGDGHTCGVRGEGLLFGWGRNTAGNLGLGQTTDPQRRSATQIGTEQDWVAVVSGQDGSCGIRSGGLLFCWGGNAFGALGLGDLEARLVPTQLAAPADDASWQNVSLDTFHACGIDSESRLYCWGRNVEGQLGTADHDDRLVPTQVANAGTDFLQVAVGRFSSCAVTAAGAVFCTGENVAGQLGVADDLRRNAFAEVSFP